MKVFLLTYRAFATPTLVIDHLTKRYAQFVTDLNNADWKMARFRIGNFLKKWITENYFEFVHDTVRFASSYNYL